MSAIVTSKRCMIMRVLTGRWFMVFASLLIMSASGATYIFGLYSSVVKTSMGYDQSTLNLLSFFKDLGGNLGVLSGLINEVTPPWVVLLIGAAMNFSGYFLIWLSVTKRFLTHTSVWQMCLFICLGANSQSFANTGALVTCVKNFPESRGIVLGLLKGYVGLSGAIITQLYHGLYGTNPEALILLIAWLPTAMSLVFLRTVRIMKTTNVNNIAGDKRRSEEVRVFYSLLYISLGLAGFLMVLIIVQNRVGFTRKEYYASAAVVTFFLFLPMAIVLREQTVRGQSCSSGSECSKDTTVNRGVDVLQEISMTEAAAAGGGSRTAGEVEKEHQCVSCFTNVFRPPERGEDHTILQALFSVDMLILFIATTAGVGGTLTAIDNLGQIGRSLGYPSRSITTFVSLVSIWNYLGRVVSGFSSEIFLARYRLPRPAMLTGVLFLSCVGHLLIAFAVPNSLYVASMIIGFCFGAQWPLIFAIISEIFGLKYYSTLYNFGAVASPVGCYILSVLITGKLYDRQAHKQLEARGLQREAGEELVCSGVECYRMSFLVIIGATLFGCLVSVLLVIRTREFYRGDIYKKFRIQERANPEQKEIA